MILDQLRRYDAATRPEIRLLTGPFWELVSRATAFQFDRRSGGAAAAVDPKSSLLIIGYLSTRDVQVNVPSTWVSHSVFRYCI